MLPDLRDNVRNWGTLTPERRQTVPLAIFAVATLLEDARLLQWAGRAVEAIGDEFAPLLDAMATGGDPSGSRTRFRRGGGDQSGRAGDSACSVGWDACHMVADTAAILAEDPRQPRRLKRLREQVRALDAVRGPAAAGLEAHDLMGGVRDQVAAVLDITGADWLRPAIRQTRRAMAPGVPDAGEDRSGRIPEGPQASAQGSERCRGVVAKGRRQKGRGEGRTARVCTKQARPRTT